MRVLDDHLPGPPGQHPGRVDRLLSWTDGAGAAPDDPSCGGLYEAGVFGDRAARLFGA